MGRVQVRIEARQQQQERRKMAKGNENERRDHHHLLLLTKAHPATKLTLPTLAHFNFFRSLHQRLAKVRQGCRSPLTPHGSHPPRASTLWRKINSLQHIIPASGPQRPGLLTLAQMLPHQVRRRQAWGTNTTTRQQALSAKGSIPPFHCRLGNLLRPVLGFYSQNGPAICSSFSS